MQLNIVAVVAELTKTLNILPSFWPSETAYSNAAVCTPYRKASRTHELNMSTRYCWNQRKGGNGSTLRRNHRSVTPYTTIPKWRTLALNPARQTADYTLATAWILHNTLLTYMKIELLQHGVCSHPGKYSNLTAQFTNLTPNKFPIKPYLKPFWRDADSSRAIR
jgi:hypothetical protein